MDNIESTQENTNQENTKRIDSIGVVMTTKDYVIKGNLNIPENIGADKSDSESLLFYLLNCGNLFVTIRDCLVTSKTTIEGIPEFIKCYNVNLHIVETCRIIEPTKK